jgi:flavin-dependent dehydrogenase
VLQGAGVVLSDTQPLGILREVLGQRIHKQGIKIYTGTKVTKTEVTENGVAIEIEALGRIRMISSDAVLISAEKVAEDIVESYKRPPTTFQEFQKSWEDSNPWHEFTKACRAERQSMLGRL